MKVFSKGQIVIPVEVRNALGIHPGEMLDVYLDAKRKCIEKHNIDGVYSFDSDLSRLGIKIKPVK